MIFPAFSISLDQLVLSCQPSPQKSETPEYVASVGVMPVLIFEWSRASKRAVFSLQ